MSDGKYSEVQVDTGRLREYAAQLDAICHRIDLLQQRLADVSAAGGIPTPELRIMEQSRDKLGQCVGYLRETAADFEAVERNIISRM